MFYLGDPLPRGPLHIDVLLKLWSRSGEKTTVRAVRGRAAGQELDVGGLYAFKEITLEPGAPPEDRVVELHPPPGQPLQARSGERLELQLVLTRGRARKLKLPIAAEEEES